MMVQKFISMSSLLLVLMLAPSVIGTMEGGRDQQSSLRVSRTTAAKAKRGKSKAYQKHFAPKAEARKLNMMALAEQEKLEERKELLRQQQLQQEKLEAQRELQRQQDAEYEKLLAICGEDEAFSSHLQKLVKQKWANQKTKVTVSEALAEADLWDTLNKMHEGDVKVAKLIDAMDPEMATEKKVAEAKKLREQLDIKARRKQFAKHLQAMREKKAKDAEAEQEKQRKLAEEKASAERLDWQIRNAQHMVAREDQFLKTQNRRKNLDSKEDVNVTKSIQNEESKLSKSTQKSTDESHGSNFAIGTEGSVETHDKLSTTPTRGRARRVPLQMVRLQKPSQKV